MFLTVRAQAGRKHRAANTGLQRDGSWGRATAVAKARSNGLLGNGSSHISSFSIRASRLAAVLRRGWSSSLAEADRPKPEVTIRKCENYAQQWLDRQGGQGNLERSAGSDRWIGWDDLSRLLATLTIPTTLTVPTVLTVLTVLTEEWSGRSGRSARSPR
jgi:hypothetical protein